MDHPQFIRILCAALCLLIIFKFSFGVDTLAPNQTLVDGEVLISPGQLFELGFVSRGTSRSRFLGIWYKATPDIIVWVANRNNPIIDSQGVLTLAKNGTLVLSTAQSAIIWSSNSSKAADSPVLQLLDTGNLVLVDKLKSSQESYIWQSFDYPGDTRLPGMKMVQDPDTAESKYLTSWKSADDPSTGEFTYRIDNSGLSQLTIMKGTKKIFRTGFWNGHYFNGIPALPDPTWEFETVSNRGRLISIYHPFNDSIETRLTMNYTGSLQRYMMNEQKDGWILMLALPGDTCDNYGQCGHNGVCKINKTPVCECLRGFTPKSKNDRRIFNWSSGCKRNLPLDCQKEDGFLKIEGIKFPDALNFQLNSSMSIDECHDECLKNCTCMAYADPYINNESSCLMWFGDLIDIREQTDAAGPNIYIRVPLFDLATIAAATNNFSGENVIGEGGFGPVYKGHLSAEQVIAVKRLSRTSGQGHEEFKTEVILIAKLQHRNLIRILGCCIDGEEKMLIYEYMQNKSLDYFIFGLNNPSMLFHTLKPIIIAQNPSALSLIDQTCILTLTKILHHLQIRIEGHN